MVERKGQIKSMPVKRVDKKTLQGIIKRDISQTATVMTDDWLAYRGLSKDFEHKIIKHGQGEYVNGDIHVNTIEGFWSLLKRGILGIYHHVSPEHLHRYCDEFQFRYNTRDRKDVQRFVMMLNKCEGKLEYKSLIRRQGVK